ncbi:uncharacterized protein [Dendrobates tinctorius]|uniref:uncharacterized protein isoform X1 n=1 Tax=Dendrobates tinctorius TaxID=92724 RepID=UPI003CCA0E3B
MPFTDITNQQSVSALSIPPLVNTNAQFLHIQAAVSPQKVQPRQIYVGLKTRRTPSVGHALLLQPHIFTNDENSITEHSCGDMTHVCEHCEALHFVAEIPSDNNFTLCCQKGKVHVHILQYPDVFTRLLKGQSEFSKNFMDNIRSINSSFAFASMGANISPPPGYGPYCFRIHGQIYHRTETLHPSDDQQRAFAQLYILDTTTANEQRLRCKENQKCHPTLMNIIALQIQTINPFVEAYQMLRDVEEQEKIKSLQNATVMPNITMAIKQDRTQDPRRYNNPTVSEVAVVFQNDNGEPLMSTRRISEYSRWHGRKNMSPAWTMSGSRMAPAEEDVGDRGAATMTDFRILKMAWPQEHVAGVDNVGIQDGAGGRRCRGSWSSEDDSCISQVTTVYT